MTPSRFGLAPSRATSGTRTPLSLQRQILRPMHETRRFFTELEGINIAPSGIMFNRKLPTEWVVAAESPIRNVDDPVLRARAKTTLRSWASEARTQSDAAEELTARYHVPVYSVPVDHAFTPVPRCPQNTGRRLGDRRGPRPLRPAQNTDEGTKELAQLGEQCRARLHVVLGPHPQDLLPSI